MKNDSHCLLCSCEYRAVYHPIKEHQKIIRVWGEEPELILSFRERDALLHQFLVPRRRHLEVSKGNSAFEDSQF